MRPPAHASRCCQVRYVPLSWRKFRLEDGTEVVSYEVRAAFPDSLDLSERKFRYAAIQSLLDAAALGELDGESEQFDPVWSNPDLWELKWTFPDGSMWRQYHAEPDELPGHLVAMLFHEKDLSGTSADIKDRQNACIDTAHARYIDGAGWSWGVR